MGYYDKVTFDRNEKFNVRYLPPIERKGKYASVTSKVKSFELATDGIVLVLFTVVDLVAIELAATDGVIVLVLFMVGSRSSATLANSNCDCTSEKFNVRYLPPIERKGKYASVTSKVKSFDNASYKPGGGHKYYPT
jgi:hypothetical protein